ncbi:hypothetical protein Bca4012_010824 [Brassica carinata]
MDTQTPISIRTSDGADDSSYLIPWIDAAITHKIQHLDFFHIAYLFEVPVQIPLNLYTCATLVHLRLYGAYVVNDPEAVFLPCLKIMQLEYVKYPNEATLVKLISGSPVLEDLTVFRAPTKKNTVLKVCSQTVKRVYINQSVPFGVVIDAPLLQFLMIKCYLTKNFKIINLGFTAKVDIDISLGTSNDLDAHVSSKRSMVHNFFASISRARCLVISHITVKVIKKLEPQLQFPYLSQLSASFSMFDLNVLPIILRSCPKIKSLILDLVDRPRNNGEPKVMFSSVPPCLISSLKFVELKSPILGYEGEIELVRYFLKNSRVLEKLTVRLAVVTAVYSNVRSLAVLSDSLSLINMLKRRESQPELFGIMFDIYHFIPLFDVISFDFISRNFNVEADALAKSALTLSVTSSSVGA